MARLQSPCRLTSVDIAWECPAEDFSVQTNSGNGVWVDRFTQTRNTALHTHVPLVGPEVTAIRVVMFGQAPHCGSGGHVGPRAFAVRGLVLKSPALQPVVEPCELAARSTDARDRWFPHGVQEFNPFRRLRDAGAAFL